MRKIGLKASLCLSQYQVNCCSPDPCPFWPAVFSAFNYLLDWSFRRAHDLRSGWCVGQLWDLVCMGTLERNLQNNSLPQHHSLRIHRGRHSHLGLCFQKLFPVFFFFFSYIKIHSLNLWSYIELLICNDILDLLQLFLKVFQTFETLRSTSNVWVVFTANFSC